MSFIYCIPATGMAFSITTKSVHELPSFSHLPPRKCYYWEIFPGGKRVRNCFRVFIFKSLITFKFKLFWNCIWAFNVCRVQWILCCAVESCKRKERNASMLCKYIFSAWKFLLHKEFCVMPCADTFEILLEVDYSFA